MMVIGAGGHPDGVVNNPHSHTHNEGDAPSQAFLRADFAAAALDGNVPTKSEPHGHNPDQDPDNIKKKYQQNLQKLQGGTGGITGGIAGAIV
jgi:hypothetical protein